MKKISSELIYKGPIFELTHDEIEIHDKIFPRDVIHHNGGVAILLQENNKVLFVRQFRYAAQEYTWEIPAGKLEKNEDPYTCGLRELEEECAYSCSHMEFLYEMYSTPGFCNEKIYIYKAIHPIKITNPKPMDEDEDIQTKWFTLEETMHMIQNKEIKDAKTIIALQYAFINK